VAVTILGDRDHRIEPGYFPQLVSGSAIYAHSDACSIALGAFAAIGILLAMAVILERKGKVIAEKKAPAAGEI
jgi:hypothetical protein